ncbi:PilW family protein [Rheinheimera gaetbuli]
MQKQQGFTLIEVLIASSILFLAIAIAVISFSATRQTSVMATERIALHTPLNIIVDQVETALRPAAAETLSGEGRLGSVAYRWQANLNSRYSPKAIPTNEQDGSQAQVENRFLLFDIQIQLESAGAKRSYSYQKLGWSDKP